MKTPITSLLLLTLALLGRPTISTADSGGYFSMSVGNNLEGKKWCYATPQPDVYFVADAEGRCNGLAVGAEINAKLNSCASMDTRVNVRESSACRSEFGITGGDIASVCGAVSKSTDRRDWRRAPKIWCVSNDSIHAHHVGRCATEGDNYVGTPISSCGEYPTPRATLEQAVGYDVSRCLNSNQVLISEGLQVTSFKEQCDAYIASLTEPGQNNNHVVENNNDNIDPNSNNGANPGNTVNPGQVVLATPSTPIEKLDCDLTHEVATAHTSSGDVIDWGNNRNPAGSSASGNKAIIARSREDGSANENFMEGQLLVKCEQHGTENWANFMSKLNKENDQTAWAPSWNYIFTKMLPIDRNRDNIIAEADFSDQEAAFVHSCLAKDKTNFLKNLSTSTNEKAKVVYGKIQTVIRSGLERLASHRKFLEKCETLVHLTMDSDYDREYTTGSRSNKTTKASFDGKVTCETFGPEAQDFKKCSTFIDTYDASMVAKTALNQGQGIHYQGQTMDRQAELARQGQTGGIDHRGALGAQKDDIKDRANYATQTAALDSAKLAGLFAILQSMPNYEKLVDSCEGSFIASKKQLAAARVDKGYQDTLKAFLDPMGASIEDQFVKDSVADADGLIPDSDSSQKLLLSKSASKGECNAVAYDNGSSTLIMNSKMRAQAKAVLAQTAIEAASSFAAAGMLNKQARAIDELLKKIEGYDPADDFVAPNTDLLAGPCAFDPAAEGCAGAVPTAARDVGFGGSSLSFGGGGFGTSGVSLDADTGYENATNDGSGDSNRSNAQSTVGSLLPPGSKQTGFAEALPGAGSAKSSAAKRASGGGGSGATAVGSTGSGGGGNSQGSARGGQASGGKQLAYAGSSIGRLSGGRGVGRKPASKDGAANPFANMFKKGGPGNETLNFRGPAGIGSKKGSIFDQISNRYKVVQKDELLLKYESK